MYCCFVLLLYFVGYYLLTFYWFVSLVETFVTELVLVPLFTTVLFTDFSSAFIASASFRWLLLVTSGGSNRFARTTTLHELMFDAPTFADGERCT